MTIKQTINLAHLLVIIMLLPITACSTEKKQVLRMTDSELESKIEQINTGLPMLLDKAMRMERLSMEKRPSMEHSNLHVYFTETALPSDWQPTDIRNIGTGRAILAYIVNKVCSDEFLRPLINGGRKISAIVKNKTGTMLLNVLIDKPSCK